MLDLTPITPPRVPLIDPRTGLIERSWYMFFLSLFKVTQGAEDALLVPNIGALLASYDEAVRTLAAEVRTAPVQQEVVFPDSSTPAQAELILPNNPLPAQPDFVLPDNVAPATEPPMPDNNGTVASASTLDLTQITSSVIDVTGTTTITVIVIPEGQTRTLRFTGTLTLVQGTELVLPDLLDVKTLAGDYAEFRGYSAGVVRCANYATAKTNTNADLASAATLDLTTIAANVINVTGTTTVTAITLREGITKTLRFTGPLTLTNGASLILPGAANIVTAAEDFAEFRGYASGVVRCTGYTANVTTAGAIAAATHAATSKTTPVDADEMPLADSAASFGLKKLTWANLKATLATWINGELIPATFTTVFASYVNGLRLVGSLGRLYYSGGTILSAENSSTLSLFVDGDTRMRFNATSTTNYTAFEGKTVKVTDAAGFISSDGSTGYTGTITTASLVGNTVVIKDGIITGII